MYEVVGHYDNQLDILSGGDHILIIRSLVDYKVRYKIPWEKLPRPTSDAEFIEEAQKKDLEDLGKGVFLQMHLLKGEGGVYYYTNSGP